MTPYLLCSRTLSLYRPSRKLKRVDVYVEHLWKCCWPALSCCNLQYTNIIRAMVYSGVEHITLNQIRPFFLGETIYKNVENPPSPSIPRKHFKRESDVHHDFFPPMKALLQTEHMATIPDHCKKGALRFPSMESHANRVDKSWWVRPVLCEMNCLIWVRNVLTTVTVEVQSQSNLITASAAKTVNPELKT